MCVFKKIDSESFKVGYPGYIHLSYAVHYT